MTRWSGRRPSGDGGASTLDYVGTLALVVLLLGAVLAAYLANTGTVANRTASLICQILTLGQGDCGDSTTDDTRQPDEPCVLESDSYRGGASISFTYVEVGGGRTFGIEKRSDGSYKVSSMADLDVLATAGVGAHTSVTVNNNTIAQGAAADIKGGVTFSGGQEWIVPSQKEVDQILAADAWNGVDHAATTALPGIGFTLPLARRALGIGEQYPPADSVYVAGGLTASGSGSAGAGLFASGAGAKASRVLGYRHDTKTDQTTYYFESTVEGSASAEVAMVPGQDWKTDQAGAGLSGKATVMTAVTLDANKNVVSGSLSALAAGSSAGLTNMLFGGDPTAYMSENVAGGTQWDATLQVRNDADREAVVNMMISANIDPGSLGLHEMNQNSDLLKGQSFMDVVRDRGELTRYNAALDDTTYFAASGEVSATAKVGLGVDISNSKLTASDPQYWNGREFVDRTNC